MANPSIIKDRMVYLVICGHKSGPYIPERNIADMDRKSIVADIASGKIDDVLQVIEFNPIEGTSRDVTEDIAHDVMTVWADEGEPLLNWQFEFVEQFIGFRAANSFQRAA